MADYRIDKIIAYPPPHVIRYWQLRGDSPEMIAERTILKSVAVYVGNTNSRQRKRGKKPNGYSDRSLTYHYQHLQIYEVIDAWWQNYGYAPTYRELCAACGFSMGSLTYHLNTMRSNGLIAWQSGRMRTLKVINHSED